MNYGVPLLAIVRIGGYQPVACREAQTGSEEHVGRVVDWSYHHIVVSGPISTANLDRARREPRILFHLAERNLRPAAGFSRAQIGGDDNSSRGQFRFGPIRGRGFPGRPPGRPPKKRTALERDWSVSLGAGSLAPNMFPAKFGFNPDATLTLTNCTTDYAVFGLNVAGSATQANLVGITNLYSGTGGFCGAAPTVNWAYDGTNVSGGKILTSTVVSLDGTQIAYVESAATSAVFHVLTWKAGEGTSATNAVTPTAVGGCSASTSCLRSLTYSSERHQHAVFAVGGLRHGQGFCGQRRWQDLPNQLRLQVCGQYQSDRGLDVHSAGKRNRWRFSDAQRSGLRLGYGALVCGRSTGRALDS